MTSDDASIDSTAKNPASTEQSQAASGPGPVSADAARDEGARLRAEEHHTEFAIRREEQAMAKEERRLARESGKISDDERRTEVDLEAEIRTEHWGHDPERPLAWKDRQDDASS